MKLTLEQIVDLHRGITALDAGYETTVDGKNARRPFKYGSVVHFPLQQNAAAIMPHLQAFEKANAALFKQNAEAYTDDKGAPNQRVPADKLAEYKAQIQDLLARVVTVRLYQVKASDMKIGTGEGENPIPIQALTWLGRTFLDDRAKDQLVEVADADDAAPSEAKG